MRFPKHKTKIVATIGPASGKPEVIGKMIAAGMNVARLNFSHGDFAGHQAMIEAIRGASQKTGARVAIMADLPGPKIRLGELAQEPIDVQAGAQLVLTTDQMAGDAGRVSVTLEKLPSVVKPGDALFINDGFVQLEVLESSGNDVHCRVVVGGELRSRKGINLPGIDLGIGAFTDHDRACLEFALAHGVDAVGQSFVEKASDIEAVREAAKHKGRSPFIIAKIERARALQHVDEILAAADGVMLARGDLGVEIPMERIAVVQKQLIAKANRAGKPVITATQMLESMVLTRRPTRAEATDVANAILDGTDCVMLSGESAVGRYPVEAVSTLAAIAAATEPHQPARSVSAAGAGASLDDRPANLVDLIAQSVQLAVEQVRPAVVIVPTRSGATARNVTRPRLDTWIMGVSALESTCQALQFSYGVFPLHYAEEPRDWNDVARDWLRSQGLSGRRAVLTAGPSARHPDANHRMEIIDLG